MVLYSQEMWTVDELKKFYFMFGFEAFSEQMKKELVKLLKEPIYKTYKLPRIIIYFKE